MKSGAIIGTAGERLRAGHIALFSACGIHHIEVGRKPRVGLLATGSELVENDGTRTLQPGQIFESNRPLIAQFAADAGALVTTYPLVVDDFEQTCAALEKAFSECDVVLTSGGVSVGDHDYVKPALEKLGVETGFWKVAVRPGKPFVFGGRDGRHFFGLPGNPVSSFVTFLLLVRPALIKLQGGGESSLPVVRGVLDAPMSNSSGRRHFARVTLGNDGRVRSTGLQASHGIAALASANGLVDVPPQTNWAEGREVDVLWVDGR